MLVVGSVIVSTFVICPVATTSGEGRYWRLLDVIVNIGIQVVEMIFELGRCQKSLKLLVELEQQHLGFHFFDPGSFLGEFFLFFFFFLNIMPLKRGFEMMGWNYFVFFE